MLSFEQAPPLSATFRFFLTAPLFGVGAGLLLAWEGPEALVSRWTPAALGLTHLLTAGLLLQIMCGAVLQFVPVVVGSNIWRPSHLSALVHACLTAGASCLVIGFAGDAPRMLLAAQVLLGAGVGGFVAAVLPALFSREAQGASRDGLRIALAGLAVTGITGLLLAQRLRGELDSPMVSLLDTHIAFGLGVWAFGLLAAVSFTVVPMFQHTAGYPSSIQRGAPGGIAACATLGALFPGGLLAAFAAGAGLALVGIFAGTTLHLQWRRKRARADATLHFFRVAMASLLVSALLLAWEALSPPGASPARLEVTTGVLVLAGGFTSAVCAMIYKIVPFIAWLKLPPRRALTGVRVTVETFIPETAVRRHIAIHFTALALLLAAPWADWLARPAGLAFAVSCAWMEALLARGALRHRRLTRRILAAASDR